MKYIFKGFCFFIAMALVVKLGMLNDPNRSFREDPLELWIGLAVVLLLMDRTFMDRED